jgi:hypothetical protein
LKQNFFGSLGNEGLMFIEGEWKTAWRRKDKLNTRARYAYEPECTK